ncbi:MAG: LysR family transcriptional regulator [Rhodospirillaceae bacterium]|nr:LysR family transcriptional regulator [Rhodospirillaceae bacterium]
MLDPVSLRLFVAVIEEGSIAAAAEREHIAAAAVSRRVSDLEALLGTALLVRSNKGVEPTAAGTDLLIMARRTLQELDGIHVAMRQYSTGVRGHVRVLANISTITQFLPRAIKSFLTAHPDVNIKLNEEISSRITKLVAENAADIGIFTAGVPTHQLELFPYRTDRLVVLIPADHPLARRRSVHFAEMLDYDFVGLRTGSVINMYLTQAASQSNRTVKLGIQVASYDAVCLMVSEGMGLGLLPEGVARPFLRALKLRTLRLDESWAQRQLLLGVRSFEALPEPAKRLLVHLRDTPEANGAADGKGATKP